MHVILDIQEHFSYHHIMFKITPAAAELINEMILKSKDNNLKPTICSSGVGCGGPTLKVEMRAPLDNDIIETVNGQTFHIRANIYSNLEGAEIKAEDTFWGLRLHVKTTYRCIG